MSLPDILVNLLIGFGRTGLFISIGFGIGAAITKTPIESCKWVLVLGFLSVVSIAVVALIKLFSGV